jgi:hypothetical protein
MTKVEELRRAFGADDYSTLARIVGGLVWERDAEARYQLAEWIESGELERIPIILKHSRHGGENLSTHRR